MAVDRRNIIQGDLPPFPILLRCPGYSARRDHQWMDQNRKEKVASICFQALRQVSVVQLRRPWAEAGLPFRF